MLRENDNINRLRYLKKDQVSNLIYKAYSRDVNVNIGSKGLFSLCSKIDKETNIKSFLTLFFYTTSKAKNGEVVRVFLKFKRGGKVHSKFVFVSRIDITGILLRDENFLKIKLSFSDILYVHAFCEDFDRIESIININYVDVFKLPNPLDMIKILEYHICFEIEFEFKDSIIYKAIALPYLSNTVGIYFELRKVSPLKAGDQAIRIPDRLLCSQQNIALSDIKTMRLLTH